MREISFQFAKYLLVGLLNSAVGLVFIYLGMALGLSDVSANAIGYLVGFGVSFAANSKWTFRQARTTPAVFARFMIVTGVAYAGNLFAMLVARDDLHFDHRLAQLVGVAAYTMIGFVGARFFAFNLKQNPHQIL
ncbi:GtrA family protein [Paraburkholderia adhaesiva]|uniref:GtrA family protein n=1 Tax=Paraburkholderia adhaesiva TaxID=2883244 RepID=UPI001F2E5688|nr:GtrA family protein [Paraburkholderia adhaesiva]